MVSFQSIQAKQTPRFGSVYLIPSRNFNEIAKVEAAGGKYWQAPVTDMTVYVKPSTADAQVRAETTRRRDELRALEHTRELTGHESYALQKYERALEREGEGTIYYGGTVLNPYDERVARLARQLATLDNRNEEGRYRDPRHEDKTKILKGYGDAIPLVQRFNIREVLSQVLADVDTSRAGADLSGMSIAPMFKRFQTYLKRAVDIGTVRQSFETHNGGQTQENYLAFDLKCPDAPPSHDD